MGGTGGILAAVVGMVVVIVAADVLLFRGHFWARLLANVAIVLFAGALYLRFRAAR